MLLIIWFIKIATLVEIGKNFPAVEMAESYNPENDPDRPKNDLMKHVCSEWHPYYFTRSNDFAGCDKTCRKHYGFVRPDNMRLICFSSVEHGAVYEQYYRAIIDGRQQTLCQCGAVSSAKHGLNNASCKNIPYEIYALKNHSGSCEFTCKQMVIFKKKRKPLTKLEWCHYNTDVTKFNIFHLEGVISGKRKSEYSHGRQNKCWCGVANKSVQPAADVPMPDYKNKEILIKTNANEFPSFLIKQNSLDDNLNFTTAPLVPHLHRDILNREVVEKFLNGSFSHIGDQVTMRNTHHDVEANHNNDALNTSQIGHTTQRIEQKHQEEIKQHLQKFVQKEKSSAQCKPQESLKHALPQEQIKQHFLQLEQHEQMMESSAQSKPQESLKHASQQEQINQHFLQLDQHEQMMESSAQQHFLQLGQHEQMMESSAQSKPQESLKHASQQEQINQHFLQLDQHEQMMESSAQQHFLQLGQYEEMRESSVQSKPQESSKQSVPQLKAQEQKKKTKHTSGQKEKGKQSSSRLSHENQIMQYQMQLKQHEQDVKLATKSRQGGLIKKSSAQWTKNKPRRKSSQSHSDSSTNSKGVNEKKLQCGEIHASQVNPSGKPNEKSNNTTISPLKIYKPKARIAKKGELDIDNVIFDLNEDPNKERELKNLFSHANDSISAFTPRKFGKS